MGVSLPRAHLMAIFPFGTCAHPCSVVRVCLCCSLFTGLGSISGRKDIGSGRGASDRISAKSSEAAKCFTSLCYSADGACILAGGKSKYVCIYQVRQQVLLKRFCISNNLSLDGILAQLNSKNMQEGGALDLIQDDSDSEVDERVDTSLPGVTKV